MNNCLSNTFKFLKKNKFFSRRNILNHNNNNYLAIIVGFVFLSFLFVNHYSLFLRMFVVGLLIFITKYNKILGLLAVLIMILFYDKINLQYEGLDNMEDSSEQKLPSIVGTENGTENGIDNRLNMLSTEQTIRPKESKSLLNMNVDKSPQEPSSNISDKEGFISSYSRV